MSFKDDLAAAKTADAPHADVTVLVNGKPYDLRFRQMEGPAWASETDRHPARPGVAVDMRYGYNIRSLTLGAAPKCGVLLDGDAEVVLRVDPLGTKDRVDEWSDLLTSLSGHDFQRITDAIWSLNEYLPEQAVDAARKARANSANTSN